MTEPEAPFARTQSDWTTRIDPRRFHTGCWIAFVAVAVVRGWFTRYELTPDSMSYLDIARLVAEGHPGAVINARSSPGYPILLSFFLRLFNPNPYWEFPLVHFVNVLIFIVTLTCFRLFWSEVLRWHRKFTGVRDAEIPEMAFWAIGYAVFSIATLNVIRVGLIAPDLLVVAFCFLAGWSSLRFRRAPSTGRALLLGLVLALGYYAKSPFFPMGVAFIICACLRWPLSRRAVLHGGLALSIFLLACAPFITALSLANGRLTFGDAARLDQAWFIDGVQYFRHWQGGPPGSGMPIHTTRKLSDYPEIYEFAKKNMGTYPPWFDPTYWYEGVTPHFNLKRQVIVFVRNLALIFQIVVESGSVLVCVAIILALFAGNGRRWINSFWRLWFVWAPGIVALTMYALIHVEPRYLGGWLILLFAGVVCASVLPLDAGTRNAVRYIGIAAIITAGASVMLQASREAVGKDYVEGRSSEDASIATGLLQNGLHAGDQVAVIGDGSGAYWAHLARLHIIAEIPAASASRPGFPAMDFWESGPESQKRALGILQGTGAEAVIGGAIPSLVDTVPSRVPAGWKKIGATRAYVYLFHADK